MASLEEKIVDLEAEIAGYKKKLAKAEATGDSAKEDKLLTVIISRNDVLKELLAQQREQARDGTGVPRRNTPPQLADKQVFILGQGPDCRESVITSDLFGTCFAVTKTHILTAHHLLCEEDEVTPRYNDKGFALEGKFLISRRAIKAGENEVFESPMEVKLIDKDKENDWALLELVDSTKSFPAWLQLCDKSTLPDLDTEVVDLKAYFAPIGQFRRNSFLTLHIWVDEYRRVLQYDRPQNTNLIVDGGLYRGSCGSPYLNHHGKVVALHLGSEHEGQNVSLVKAKPDAHIPLSGQKRSVRITATKVASSLDELATKMTSSLDEVIEYVTDLGDVHASTRVGVVLANVPRLYDIISTVISSYT